MSAGNDVTTSRDALRELRDGAETSELLEPATTRELSSIESRLRRASRRLDSPVLAPVRVLPVVGRQVRTTAVLTSAAVDASSLAGSALRRVGDVLADARAADTDRVGMLRTVAQVSADAGDGIDAIDLGSGDALIAPIEDARTEMARELRDVRGLLRDVEEASGALAEVLRGPSCQLLLAANNAEMRAGSGMFLQAGELCFYDGDISLGPLEETSELMLPADAVEIEDPDLRDRWGHLLPNAEWRNLALSPRFDASAPLAADMWEAATGRRVDGVIAVDPVALSVLLGSTGPIEVSGVRYDAGSVVEHLLVEQYEDFLDPGYDPGARQDRLGEVATAAVAAFDAGGWNLETLVDGLPRAAAGRHILAWSRAPRVQQAWETMGVTGALEPHSVAVSVLNRSGGRGGGKLDAALEVRARLRVDRPQDGLRAVTVEVELHNTVAPDTPTYAENPDAPDVRFGVYSGILSVNVPGAAGFLEADGEELAARGDDGPTRVIAVPVEVGPGVRRTRNVTFELPVAVESVRLEPSARIPPIEWRLPDGRWVEDVLGRTVRW